MKSILFVFFMSLFTSALYSQHNNAKTTMPDSTKKNQVVEVSCGQCKLGLPGKSCDMAVRINGKSYFVDGTSIDSHGDAHASDGFCNAIRKAEVQGEIVKNRFKLTYIKLLPETTIKN